MKRLLFPVLLLFSACASDRAARLGSLEVEHSSEPGPVPLALDDAFNIRKVFTLLIDPATQQKALQAGGLGNGWLRAEVERRYFGAVSGMERRSREGHYYTVHWSTARAADVRVRMEYRQQKLGLHVQSMERLYPRVKGAQKTEFSVIGDDYHDDGAVTAWRITLIENGRIVAVTQSFLW
jgi:hypothetical protein